MRSIIVLFLGLLSAVSVMAQPPTTWVHLYHHHDDNQDWIEDIYHTTDGDWACCGETFSQAGGDMWLLVVNPGGEVVFSQAYAGNEGERVCERAFSLIQTEAGGYLLGGDTQLNAHDMCILLTEANGDPIWMNIYGGRDYDICNAVIELKDGNFILAGRTRSFGAGDYDGWLVKIDVVGNVIWDHTYGTVGMEEFKAVREVDGGFMVAGQKATNGGNDYWLVRTDEVGEVVWQRNYGVQNRNEYLEDMTSCRDGGFILAGDRPRTDKPYLVRINAQGDILWENNFLGNDEVWCSTNAGSIVQLPDNGFAFAGHNSGITMMLRTDEAGNFQWSRYNNFGADGNSFFTTILCDESGGIIAGGSLWTLEHNVEGLLVKYIPDRTPPYFRSFEPDSLALIVLLNDNIHFEVHARDLQDDSIRYVWTYVADTVSTDSMVTIQFRELGDWTVRCAISDGDEEIFIEWQVEVSNFFIRSASPHEFDLIARRNSTLLFSLDVACVEPDQWTTEWTMVDRNLRRNPLGEEDSLDVCFDMAGDCAVEAVIEWRGEEERLRWDVAVRSAVWWWDPHQDTVTVYRDSSAEFNVIPFNRESDSLSFEWTLNGRLMDWDESLLVMDFMDNMDLGGHELKVVCRDGSEADTIGWAVQVIPREGAPFAEALRPAEPRLYPPAPNPFNFTTTISFSLPARAPVSLRIYDLNGRLLQDLSPLGSLNPGQHEVVWNARKLPTGIYFVRLESGGRSAVRRTFLLK